MLSGLRRGKAAPHNPDKEVEMTAPMIKVIRIAAIAILAVAVIIPAIAGIAVQLNQDIPSWFYARSTGLTCVAMISGAVTALIFSPFWREEFIMRK